MYQYIVDEPVSTSLIKMMVLKYRFRVRTLFVYSIKIHTTCRYLYLDIAHDNYIFTLNSSDVRCTLFYQLLLAFHQLSDLFGVLFGGCIITSNVHSVFLLDYFYLFPSIFLVCSYVELLHHCTRLKKGRDPVHMFNPVTISMYIFVPSQDHVIQQLSFLTL